MSNQINKILEELSCLVYKYDKDNFIIYNNSSSTNSVIKELIKITFMLDTLNIKFEIDKDYNILLSNQLEDILI